MLAFEREADQALVVGAGIPAEWLEGDAGVGVSGLPTSYGTLEKHDRELGMDPPGIRRRILAALDEAA